MFAATTGAGKRHRLSYISTVHEPSPLFQAIIVPQRSLSERGQRMLLLAICGMCGLSACVFVRIGAWPVGGFTGVELLLAAVLFRLHARAARASEMLLLTPDALRIVRTAPGGQRQVTTLPQAWLCIRLRERPGRVPALILSTHGREVEVASAIGENAKRDLEQALSAALRNFRNPVFDNPQLREPI
jgi:uncharacterized membrane protein